VIFGGCDPESTSPCASGNDVIFGAGGNDVIFGAGGNDVIFGGCDPASPTTSGRCSSGVSGNDVISGGGGNDVIFGAGGNDVIFGGCDPNSTSSGVSCVSGNDVIFGSGGNDVIFGSGGNDVIFGGCETDSTVTGPLSASCISGVSGNDVIFGAGGNDVIFGAEGNDIIFGGCDPDSATPTCASGNDVIFGAAGNDIIFAADGNDVVFGAAGNDIIFGGDDDGNDLLYSGTGSDQMTGGAGDTGYLLVPDGIDSVMDSGGVDWLNFAAANAGVSLDLSLNAGQLQTVDANGSILSLNGVFENLRGSSFADFVTGDGGNNILIGAGGADTLLGAGGADVLRGGVSTQVVYLDFDTESGPGDYVYSSLERAQILGRIQLDFSGFDFQFFETRAGAELAASLNGGVFSTLFFNKPPAGGESDELDWRNTNPGASASIDVNTLLGGDGEPDATSANFVAISATVAAHELGHLVSLRHADSFGPIGSGMFEGLSAATYRPPYPGPTSATETPQHLMASPASVHTTLFDAVGNPYFGERELIKLSFAERGTSDTEDATDHGSMAVAQSLGLLPGLPVPNTMPAGANAGQEFAVRAISVLGAVGLGGDGKSSSDFYSFSGTAGQLVNVEIYSESLERARLGNPIDSVMRVYNSSGTLVGYYTGTAVNDDTFEATDSQILDLVLPTDDTYFVEVDTFTFIGNSEFEYSDFCLPDGQPIDPEVTSADACSDTDTGGYELFISTFSIGATLGLDNPGDFLFGSTGNDHLTGSYAQDQLDAGAGNDSMFGLTGNDIYVEVPGSADLINDTAGVDTLDFSGATSNIQIDVSLTLGQVQTVDSAGNTLAITGTIENVIGSSFGDLINGNAAANFLSGGPGNDTLNGGAGDDTFTGGTGVDAINGGPDIDRVVETRNANMTLSNTTLSIGAEGNDSLTSIEQAILTGGSSNNQLNASSFSGTTTLVGLAGNDTLTGGSNADVLEGGEGNDNISGQGGNDKLDGGADNDTLVGEAGSDILLGGAGDDSLTGAADSDFLIGGLGADRLVDSAGDDLEIGGSTAYDSVDEALRMILAEWISGRDYATRVKNIRDGSGSADRLNGPYFLTLVPNAATPIATVFDDFAQDRLTGSSGLDWFFIGTGDIVTDLKNGEQVN
jgi:Ca2+-binding RTX toxin-like protein